MSVRGGVYEGPGGQKLYGDGREVTVHVCGVKCEHVWDGPMVEFDGGRGVTTTCSKCGEWAINVSLMEGP